MAMTILVTLAALFASLLALAIAPVAHHRLKLFLASRRRNCASPPMESTLDPIFGIDTLVRDVRDITQHRRNKQLYATFQKYGKTYAFHVFGRRTICTIDPRNVQFVLATAMEKFSVGPGRQEAALPLVGKGVLTTDGESWRYGRGLIMPVFAKAQIADREMFERHVGGFLERVGGRSGTLDLKEFFDELVSLTILCMRMF